MLHNALIRFCNDTINDKSVFISEMGIYEGKVKGGRRLSSYVKKLLFYQTKDPTRSPLRKRVFVLNYSPIVSSTPAAPSVKKVKSTPKKNTIEKELKTEAFFHYS